MKRGWGRGKWRELLDRRKRGSGDKRIDCAGPLVGKTRTWTRERKLAQAGGGKEEDGNE